jgi:hypothetical protein
MEQIFPVDQPYWLSKIYRIFSVYLKLAHIYVIATFKTQCIANQKSSELGEAGLP